MSLERHESEYIYLLSYVTWAHSLFIYFLFSLNVPDKLNSFIMTTSETSQQHQRMQYLMLIHGNSLGDCHMHSIFCNVMHFEYAINKWIQIMYHNNRCMGTFWLHLKELKSLVVWPQGSFYIMGWSFVCGFLSIAFKCSRDMKPMRSERDASYF